MEESVFVNEKVIYLATAQGVHVGGVLGVQEVPSLAADRLHCE